MYLFLRGYMMRMRKLYEDEEVEIYSTFDRAELEEAIIDAIRGAGRPLRWKELREMFSVLVLRRAGKPLGESLKMLNASESEEKREV